MKNLIKEYFESGKNFEDLKNELGISFNSFDDLIILNYSQIDSPKTDPLVRMCRGIVIEKDTWNIVHYPFYRFYNFEEVVEERKKFNWDNAVATTKIDGSVFGIFCHNDVWYISSRSQIGGNNQSSIPGVTYFDIFKEAIHPLDENEFFSILDKNLDYTFELVSPYNKIVTPYSESNIYLICVRDKGNNFKEISLKDAFNIEHIKALIEKEIIKTPEIIPLIDEHGKFRGFNEMRNLAESGNPTDEGFVVVDWSSYDTNNEAFPRVKVKNSAYVALHHLNCGATNDSSNMNNILKIFFDNEQDEVLATLPIMKNIFSEVEPKWNSWFNGLKNEEKKFKKFFDLPKEERMNYKKEFAQEIDKKYATFLFYMFNNNCNSVHETLEQMANNKENFWKNLWKNYVSSEESF